MFDIIGGVGVLRDCLGRMGLMGGGGRYSLRASNIYTSRIGSNDEDSKNNVKSLVTSHKAAILEK